MHDATSTNFVHMSNIKPIFNNTNISIKEDNTRLCTDRTEEKYGNIEYSKCLTKALEKALEENDLVQ